MAFKIYLVKKLIKGHEELKKSGFADIIFGKLTCDDDPETMTIFKVWDFFNDKNYKSVSSKNVEELKQYNISYWLLPGFGEIYIYDQNEKISLLAELKTFHSNFEKEMTAQIRAYFKELVGIIEESINLKESTIVIDTEY